MLTDIEIAQKNQMKPITAIADGLGIQPDELEQYGHYKAKISFDAIKRLEKEPNGKLVLVTAITPTPAGEGKSTTSIGLVDSLRQIGKKAIVALREPSLGPVLVLKVGLLVVAMLKLCQWMILICTLLAICMLLRLPIIYWQL